MNVRRVNEWVGLTTCWQRTYRNDVVRSIVHGDILVVESPLEFSLPVTIFHELE